jgi:hypothetical protein
MNQDVCGFGLEVLEGVGSAARSEHRSARTTCEALLAQLAADFAVEHVKPLILPRVAMCPSTAEVAPSP